MQIRDILDAIEPLKFIYGDIDAWDVFIEVEPWAPIRHIFQGEFEVYRLTDARSVIVDMEHKRIGICYNGEQDV